MRKYLIKLPDDLKGIISLVRGNSVALFLPLLIAPILTRVYNEIEFAEFTIFVAIVLIISSFATGRFDVAILESKNFSEAKQLSLLAIIVSLVVTIITLGCIYLYDHKLASVFDRPSITYIYYLIPVAVLTNSVFQIAQALLNREEQYSIMSRTKITKSGATSVIQILSKWKIEIGSGLVLGRIAGDVVASLYSLYYVLITDEFRGARVSLKRLVFGFKRYNRYLYTNSVHAFLTTLSGSMPPLILGVYFTKEVVGYYGLSLRVCVLPVTLIAHAFFQVISREFTIQLQEKGDLVSYFKRRLIQLVVASILPFLVLLFFSPELFSFVFDDTWYTSGVYAQILSPYLFLVFVVSPFAFIPTVLQKHKQALIFESVSFTTKIIILVIGGQLGSDRLTLSLFSGTSAFFQLGFLIWVYYLTKSER